METFINEITIFPLMFVTIVTFPIFFGGHQSGTTRTFYGKSSENQIRDTGENKIGTDEFELKAGSKLIEFAGTGQNDIDQKCKGCNREKFKPKVKIDRFQGFFFHVPGSR